MSLVEEFLERYSKEFLFFNQASQEVAGKITARVRESGIRAIVTHRAKEPASLRSKLEKRNAVAPYATVSQIYEDLIDLAGVRVAVYFPAQTFDVSQIIESTFNVVIALEYPQGHADRAATPRYRKQFSGYKAFHYRILYKPDGIPSTAPQARVEIQVASVLMHAWAEVEHDLVYKPKDLIISDEELMILDEINGLVLAGEIALTRLEKAGERRTERSVFNNHYDLGSYLAEKYPQIGLSNIGDVEWLFKVLFVNELHRPVSLENLSITQNTGEDSPDSIVDSIFAALTREYSNLKTVPRKPLRAPSPSNDLSKFLAAWGRLERFLVRLGQVQKVGETHRMPFSILLQRLDLDSHLVAKLTDARNLRNQAAQDATGSIDLKQEQFLVTSLLHQLEREYPLDR